MFAFSERMSFIFRFFLFLLLRFPLFECISGLLARVCRAFGYKNARHTRASSPVCIQYDGMGMHRRLSVLHYNVASLSRCVATAVLVLFYGGTFIVMRTKYGV